MVLTDQGSSQKGFLFVWGTGMQTLKSMIDVAIMAHVSSESPIEYKLNCAFQRSEKFKVRFDDIIPDEKGLYVYPQITIGNYRVDFLIAVKPEWGKDFFVIVECDGKDWHSSTEQVEYDRVRQKALEDAGYSVIRFTGRRITRGSSDCVQNVEEQINRLIFERYNALER